MSGVGLVLYENARRALAQLREVDEIAEMRDKAQAVEEYARRAKDRTLEIEAAAYRSYCEERLGQVSAEAVRPRPGGSYKHCPDLGNASRSDVARRAGVSRQHLRRVSEPLAALPEGELDSRVEALKAEGEPPTPRKVLDMSGPLMSSQSDEWYTPAHMWEAALSALLLDAFDLDPCAEPAKAVRARQHFTQSDDGLAQPWRGSVWINPPYSAMKDWISKLRSHWHAGDIESFAALVPARVDTRWWDDLTLGNVTVVLVRGRLRFGGTDNSAPFPSAVVFGGASVSDCRSAFKDIGRVWVPA